MNGGLWAALARLLVPTRCALCSEHGLDTVCAVCLPQLAAVGACCTRCGRQRLTSYASPDCGECHGQNLGYAQARSCLVYNAAGRALLAEYKFNRREPAGDWLAGRLGQFVADGVPSLYGPLAPLPALVVPVPIHAQRRRERGFNQAETLASAAARQLHLPVAAGALQRVRPTPSQVGLSAAQRRANVRGAFAVPPREQARLTGQCVILVDDLMTTGATLRACALALRRGGAKAVLGLTAFSTVQAVEPPAAAG